MHLLIFLAILATFSFYNSSLSKFSLEASALLVALYTLFTLKLRHNRDQDAVIKYRNISNIIIGILLTLLLILSTGGAQSDWFFLLDFTLFGIALIASPATSFTASLAIIIMFLLNEPMSTSNQLINLFSLLSMAPIASFFSTQYLRLLEASDQIKVLEHQSKHLEKSLAKEETSTLVWLSLDFHNKIAQAIDLTSQLLSNLSKIPYHQRDQLVRLHSDLKALLQSGQDLKTRLDEVSDDQ